MGIISNEGFQNIKDCRLTYVASGPAEPGLALPRRLRVPRGDPPPVAVVPVADALEGGAEAAAVEAAGQRDALVARQPLPPHRARAHVRPHAVAVRTATLQPRRF